MGQGNLTLLMGLRPHVISNNPPQMIVTVKLPGRRRRMRL